jgi:hypothetical protein
MAEPNRAPIPVDVLREFFTADDSSPSGLRWKKTGTSVGARYRQGSVAGSAKSGGYWQTTLTIDGKAHRLLAHRVVFALHTGAWPVGVIDHINGNRSDNRASNLRDATHTTNARNIAGLPSHNVSGFPGVSRHAKGGWQVSIRSNSRNEYIGHFTSKKAAIVCAYETKLKRHPEAAAYLMRWEADYHAAQAALQGRP